MCCKVLHRKGLDGAVAVTAGSASGDEDFGRVAWLTGTRWVHATSMLSEDVPATKPFAGRDSKEAQGF